MEKTKLIEARKSKGLSQNFLAEKLCVTVSNYNRRERGQTKISADEWQKIAKVLEVPLEDIYDPEESQVFIFNDNATGNVNSVINYNIPLSMWETQKKYIEKLAQEIQQLKDSL